MSNDPSREEIFSQIRSILSDSFELDAEKITPASTLYEELDLDSIDAIDIFTQLRELTGRRPDPGDARQVRTVDELIDFVYAEIEKTKAGVPEGPVEGAAKDAPSAASKSSENEEK